MRLQTSVSLLLICTRYNSSKVWYYFFTLRFFIIIKESHHIFAMDITFSSICQTYYFFLLELMYIYAQNRNEIIQR